MTTTKTLRQLLDEASSAISIYKNPDIDELRERLNPVLEAAGLGSTGRDHIAAIDEYAGMGGYFEIRTEWSARQCAQTSEYRLPVSIVDAADPLQTAAAWKEAQHIERLRDDFTTKHRAAEKAAHALFAALPVGPERIRVSDVYENIRNATRV